MLQSEVFDKAQAIYEERNLKYKNTWRQYGALAQLVRAAQKIDRVMAVWWHEKGERSPLTLADLDDAYDAINHLAFFIRLATEGDITGDPPERPTLCDHEFVLHYGGVVGGGSYGKCRKCGALSEACPNCNSSQYVEVDVFGTNRSPLVVYLRRAGVCLDCFCLQEKYEDDE